MKIIPIFLVAVALMAQELDKPKEQITAEMRAAFWRATLQKVHADTAYQAAIKAMQQACEEKKQMLSQDEKGEPACVETKK